jgi:RNA polymerase sigma-70 factor (ECF subfamily)
MISKGSNLEYWIEKWRAGDQHAAETIYNLHRERTFRLSFALLGNSEDAEEAAQDALSYALIHINQFDSKRSKFSTWLHMITVSRSRDVHRKRRSPVFSLSTHLKQRSKSQNQEPTPEKLIEKWERNEEIWDAVQKLTPLLREAIVLRHWGQHTYREISQIVGCPLKTAQSRVRLAHQKLTQLLIDVDQPQYSEETS